MSLVMSDSQFAVVTSLDDSEKYNQFEEAGTSRLSSNTTYLVVTPLDISDASEFYRETKNAGE